MLRVTERRLIQLVNSPFAARKETWVTAVSAAMSRMSLFGGQTWTVGNVDHEHIVEHGMRPKVRAEMETDRRINEIVRTYAATN